MTKKTINLGGSTDDFTGDYLRKGGQKINSNFDEIFDELGDTEKLHPAGAWKSWSFISGVCDNPAYTDEEACTLNAGTWDNTLYIQTGEQYNIDTTAGSFNVYLPGMGIEDYGRVIKIRDIYGQLSTNSIQIFPDGDTVIKDGNDNTYYFAAPLTIDTNFADIELIFTYDGGSGTWRYISGYTLTDIPPSGELSLVRKDSFILGAAPTGEFVIAEGYNAESFCLYLNGVLLHYDPDELLENELSAYGATRTGVADVDLTPLDGTNVALRLGTFNEGDDVSWISYMGNVTGEIESYKRYTVKIVEAAGTTIPGETVYITTLDDTEPARTITLGDFGGNATYDRINVNSAQVYVNGSLWAQSPMGGYAADLQYSLIETVPAAGYDAVLFGLVGGLNPLNDGDYVTLIYFDKELGSILPMEGDDSIHSRGDELWIKVTGKTLRNRYQNYTDLTENSNGEINTKESNVVTKGDSYETIDNLFKLFNVIYPIGSVYENATNPANPGLYMGFGTWKKFSVAKVTMGTPSSSVSGDTGGSSTVILTSEQMPLISSNKSLPILYQSENDADPGETAINITGCLPDAIDLTQNQAWLKSETITIGTETPDAVNILPPFIYTHKWVRIE